MLFSADTLAKSFYSAISVDLGIVDGSNVLPNEALLQQYTSNYSAVDFGMMVAGPATASYNELKAKTGKPEVTQSTIFTTYLCQTPTRKLAISLVVSVLLANLVLLRALWTILTLIAGYFVEARDPKGEFIVLLCFSGILTNADLYSQLLYAVS